MKIILVLVIILFILAGAVVAHGDYKSYDGKMSCGDWKKDSNWDGEWSSYKDFEHKQGYKNFWII